MHIHNIFGMYIFDFNKFEFPGNNSSIDIQSVEPVDQRTRDALQKSVQLAIEIAGSFSKVCGLQSICI